MTQISSDDVQDLARMSALQLSDMEVQSLTTDIQSILQYVEQLNELNTDGVDPTYQVNDLSNVWRDDVAVESLDTGALLALSPEQQQQQIKVPKVL